MGPPSAPRAKHGCSSPPHARSVRLPKHGLSWTRSCAAGATRERATSLAISTPRRGSRSRRSGTWAGRIRWPAGRRATIRRLPFRERFRTPTAPTAPDLPLLHLVEDVAGVPRRPVLVAAAELPFVLRVCTLGLVQERGELLLC